MAVWDCGLIYPTSRSSTSWWCQILVNGKIYTHPTEEPKLKLRVLKVHSSSNVLQLFENILFWSPWVRVSDTVSWWSKYKMTLGHWPWPMGYRNGWSWKVAFLLRKSVYINVTAKLPPPFPALAEYSQTSTPSVDIPILNLFNFIFICYKTIKVH